MFVTDAMAQKVSSFPCDNNFNTVSCLSTSRFLVCGFVGPAVSWWDLTVADKEGSKI
jgi:hypothetical protein